MLGIQLGGDAQDAIIDVRDMNQFLLLRLPVDVGFPQPVGAKVCACRQYRMFISTKESEQTKSQEDAIFFGLHWIVGAVSSKRL